MNIDDTTSINNTIIKKKKKSQTYLLDSVFFFFMLLAVNYFEIFPKQMGYVFISESFALNGCIFVALTNEKLLLLL